MTDLAYFEPNERTEFYDNNYAVVGRALTFATHFENRCQILARYIHFRDNGHLMDANKFIQLKKSIDKFTSKIMKALQKGNISEDIQNAFNESIFKFLDIGREARNFIAHELAVGLVDEAESDDFRKITISLIKEKIEQVARADFYICCFLENVINKRPVHPDEKDYIDRITKWVCEIYD